MHHQLSVCCVATRLERAGRLPRRRQTVQPQPAPPPRAHFAVTRASRRTCRSATAIVSEQTRATGVRRTWWDATTVRHTRSTRDALRLTARVAALIPQSGFRSSLRACGFPDEAQLPTDVSLTSRGTTTCAVCPEGGAVEEFNESLIDPPGFYSWQGQQGRTEPSGSAAVRDTKLHHNPALPCVGLVKVVWREEIPAGSLLRLLYALPAHH